ncbi:hypothetical protein [Azospirillum canadense]|uniref:hypothetical protein n=1 Tax=Azospirillum canadense TaxID=403962 RepID=UPI0022268397|nr:hypothetical protein [Azospirillum canadense]MCW2243575.1 hypothetical protein [Azospirillum canadense]
MATPMPQLELAVSGLVEFHNWLNGAPLDGAGAAQDAAPAQGPAQAAQQLMSFLRSKAQPRGA